MRLTVETGPMAGTVVSLDREHPTTLGSAADCGLRVQEAGVLPQHAVVKALKDQGFGLKALGQGVRLNGAQVEAAPLQDGDIIELGTTRIAFGQVQKRGLPTIAGYRILGELGRGGMGMVFRAEQTSLHRQVALKVLSQNLTQDPQFVAKFVAEARAAAKLQHANVVAVYDVEHDGGTYYYAMELMQESLESWLKQHGAMPADRAMAVVADAAAGLAYAESLGLVHRDIKPDNLMLDQHGTVKIADLGLAGAAEQTSEQAIGTPHFMAPEQVLKQAIDHRTDLYALGCTFYRLVTGRTPFKGQTVKDILRAQVKDEAEPAHKANPQVPAEVSGVIAKLMAKDPALRYQTANDLLAALQQLMQPPAKKGLWIGLAAAAAVVAGGAIYWAITKPKEIVEVEKRYDDPEKQQFADEIKRLKKDAKEAQATIALLTARLSGNGDAEQAAALAAVARDHAGTAAAAEATQRATELRNQLAERERQQAARKGQAAEFLASLQQAQAPLLAREDFGEAEKALGAAPPASLGDDAELKAGLQQLRTELQAKARTRLEALTQAVGHARASGDATALGAAIEALDAALRQPARWPAALRPQLEEPKALLVAARETLGGLQRDARQSVWLQFRDAVQKAEGLMARAQRGDFAGAGAAAQEFATAHPGEPAGEHAAALATALQQAQAFGEALDRAIAAGQVSYRAGDGSQLAVLRLDWKAQKLVVADPAKKPQKEQLLALEGIGLETFAALAESVAPPAPGSRESWLGFLSLGGHAQAARDYLSRVRPGDDATGTGAAGYPLGATLLEALLRRLPEDQAPWLLALRRELQAGTRLAAALRALSERRNLAAAAHLDKLFADAPHSLVVALLP
ncbi:MAG: protein kinase [Planctomycetes bacterium]|nr:protein kinase [Planctomycetota bacterium]